MEGIPFKCRRCKEVFTSHQYGFTEARSLSFKGVAEQCRCGGMAYAIDGVYSLDKGYVSSAVADRPSEQLQLSRMVSRLRILVDEVKDAIPDSSELLDRVEQISPELANGLRARLGKNPLAWFIVAVLVWFLHNVKLEATVDINELIDQAVATLQDNPPARQNMQPAQIVQNIEVHVDQRVVNQEIRSQAPEKPTKRQLRRQRGRNKSQPRKSIQGP